MVSQNKKEKNTKGGKYKLWDGFLWDMLIYANT